MKGCGAESVALTGGVGLLERAVGYTLGNLHLIRGPAELTRPTPCRDWDLRALLTHLAGSLAALQEAAEAGEVSLGVSDGAPGAAPLPGDFREPRVQPARYAAADALGGGGCPVARVRDRAYQLVGAWTRVERPEVTVADAALTGPLVAGVGALEVAVHGWDAARAMGADRPLPEPLAEELLALAPLFLRDSDRPGRFDPPLPSPPDAPAATRLLAFLGRASTA